jgi:hypothetical protein
MTKRRWLSLALLAGLFFGCVTAPYTGRSQLMLFPTRE